MSVEFDNPADYPAYAEKPGSNLPVYSDAGFGEGEEEDDGLGADSSPLPSPISDTTLEDGVMIDSRPEVDQMAEFPELEMDDSAVEAEQLQPQQQQPAQPQQQLPLQPRNDNDKKIDDKEMVKSQVLMRKLKIEDQENGNLEPSAATTTTQKSTTRPTTNNIGRLLKSPSSSSNDGSWIKQKPKEDLHSVKISVSEEMASLHAENNNNNNDDGHNHSNGHDHRSNGSGSSTPEVKLWGPPPSSKEFVDTENQCFRCHDKIYPNDAVHGPLKGVFFHQKCFLCFECNRRLNLTSYFHSREDVKDSRIFCGQHQPKNLGSGYGMDSLDFKGPKIETEKVTANVFGGPQMAKGGTFDAQSLGITQFTKNAQKLGNPNSNIRGGPEASKSAGIDYQSMGIRGVVDNYQKQAAPNANIRGGPEASRSAKIGMDSMNMKAVTNGPKRDVNKTILGGPDASKSSGFGTDSLAMKGITRDPKNKQAGGDSIVRGGADCHKSANIGTDSLHIRACTDHRTSLQVSNRNVRGGPEASKSAGLDASALSIKGVMDAAQTHTVSNRNIRGGPDASKSAKIDADSWGIKAAMAAPKGDMGGNLRSKVAAGHVSNGGGPRGEGEGQEDEERLRALSRQSTEPEREEDVQAADVKNIRRMFEN